MSQRIEDYGVIASMRVPEAWRDDEPVDLNSIQKVIAFHPKEFRDVCFYLRFSGRPNGDFFQEKWMELVESGEEHEVSQSDMQQISLIVGDLCDPEYFDLKDARAENWNGKRVLLVEGIVKECDWSGIYLFADINGDGEYTQQITFGAPRMVYDHYVHEAVTALETISWKPAAS